MGTTMLPMIVSFRHKGLKELFEEGKTRRLPQERLKKIIALLFTLDSIETLGELNLPGFR